MEPITTCSLAFSRASRSLFANWVSRWICGRLIILSLDFHLSDQAFGNHGVCSLVLLLGVGNIEMDNLLRGPRVNKLSGQTTSDALW